MHGLINRSIQCFLRDTYGAAVWEDVARTAQLGFDSFEAMLVYEPSLTDAVLQAASHVLHRPRDTVLEDLGTYLVSHRNLEPLRRLLRFGGVTFVDFLHSLEDLPERGRLALPDLDLPALALADLGGGDFEVTVTGMFAGVGHVVTGLLRAMADDYGALVMLDHVGLQGGAETVTVRLLDQSFARGKRFDLAARP
jgi:hypothetical protein